jgi:hypothetical protein
MYSGSRYAANPNGPSLRPNFPSSHRSEQGKVKIGWTIGAICTFYTSLFWEPSRSSCPAFTDYGNLLEGSERFGSAFLFFVFPVAFIFFSKSFNFSKNVCVLKRVQKI